MTLAVVALVLGFGQFLEVLVMWYNIVLQGWRLLVSGDWC